jgi:mannitol-1-phosphate 5-dehydrogenase
MTTPAGDMLVFGAGNIGRGLFGQLAAEAGRGVAFVEALAPTAERLRRAGAYTVRLVGRGETATRVSGFRVLEPSEADAVGGAVRSCAFAATAVGGEHLPEIAAVLAPGLRGRERPLNVLVGENFPHADRVLADALLAAGAGEGTFACAPCSVERMVRPEPGSLDLIGEGGQSLFFDASRCAGAPPELPGLVPCRDLAPYYARKLFTNNAGHAVLAYEGHLAGCERLTDALDRPEIRARLEALLAAAAAMLVRECGWDRAAMASHVDDLLRHRFANRALADTVRRVARQPLRKLGPEERLVGLLRRLGRHGLAIAPVCRTIAAAMAYRDPDDAEAVRMAALLARGGAARVLREVCGLHPEEEAHRACMAEWMELRASAREGDGG